MRRAFCFSRVWSRYSLSFGRLRPCSPGGYGRISIGHLGESHLAPFRKSLVFSRRQRLQSAPVYRAILVANSSVVAGSDPPPLRRPAAIVRNRGDVLNRAHLEAGRLQRPDGRLTARAGALDEHVDLAHAVLHRPAGGRLGRHLRGERSRLPRALEADLAGRGPRDDASARVRYGHDRVIERALDVRVPVRDVLSFLAAHFLDAGSALWWHPARQLREVIGPLSIPEATPEPADGLLLAADLLLAGDCLLPALAGAGTGLGALAVYRQSAAVPQALVGADLDLAPDVGLDLAAQVALDLVVRLDPVPQLDDFLVSHLVHAPVAADARCAERLERAGAADAIDIGQGDLEPLLPRKVDAY